MLATRVDAQDQGRQGSSEQAVSSLDTDLHRLFIGAGGMIQITDRSIEAVAALLYNLTYDQDGGEGWTPEKPCYDPTYRAAFLAFAESLLVAMRDHPGDPDAMLIQQARLQIERTKVGFGWETIAIDEGYTSLPSEAERQMAAIWEFLANPLAAPEGAFLDVQELEPEGAHPRTGPTTKRAKTTSREVQRMSTSRAYQVYREPIKLFLDEHGANLLVDAREELKAYMQGERP
jgi:hypothetical protein